MQHSDASLLSYKESGVPFSAHLWIPTWQQLNAETVARKENSEIHGPGLRSGQRGLRELTGRTPHSVPW